MSDVPPKPRAKSARHQTSWARYAAILIVTLLALGLVLWLVFAPRSTKHGVVEEVIEGPEAEQIQVNRAHTVDAVGHRDVEAKLGYRYRVTIDDEAREGTAGVAHIGGLVTFVAGARKGEELVVEVTRIKRSVAEAVIVKRLSGAGGAETAAPPVLTQAELEQAARHGPVEVGKLYRARIEETGKQGDGVAHIDGLVVFVAGATEGQEAAFRITRLNDRFANASLVGLVGTGPAEAKAEAAPRPAGVSVPAAEASAEDLAGALRHGPVKAGVLYQAPITDIGKKGDGVAHIDGLVVFVAGGAKGETAVFRVTEVADRFARAVRVGAAAESNQVPAADVSTGSGPSADEVQPGAVFEVEVTEKDRKNPDENGVARIDGLVVFVPGTQPGDHARIRIRERRPRFAFADVIGDEAGDVPE